MTIEIEGLGTVKVKFVHIRRAIQLNNRMAQGETTCAVEIVREGGGREGVNHHAFCSMQDTFSKKTGRKLALTRALNGFPPLSLDKSARRKIWESCFPEYRRKV